MIPKHTINSSQCARNLLAVVATTFLISACSSSPSESDAQNAVERNLLGSCPQLEFEEFTKTNGIPVTDRHYKVEMRYSVQLTPTDEMQKHAQAAVADLSKINAELPVLNAAIQEYLDERSAFMDAGGGVTDFERQNEHQFNQWKQNEKTVRAYKEMIRNGPSRVRYILQSQLRKECPSISNDVLRTFFGSDVTLDSYLDDPVFEFTGTIHMVKTDNGWEEAR